MKTELKCNLTSLFGCSPVTSLVMETAAESSLNVKTPLIISLESLHINTGMLKPTIRTLMSTTIPFRFVFIPPKTTLLASPAMGQ